MIEHYDIRIYGLVQGVSFRWAATRTAANFDIMGFIRNESDGSVYIEAEGDKEDLEKFIDWCNKGPERKWNTH